MILVAVYDTILGSILVYDISTLDFAHVTNKSKIQ